MKKYSLSVVTLFVLAACGGGTTASPTTATTATTVAPTTEASTVATQEPVTVNVTADEYSFESDVTSFQVGVPYHFVVTNTGAKAHEFMILVPMESGMMDMEAMDEMALAVIEEDDLEACDEASIDHTFTADEAGQPLEFACHIEGHYEDGMHLSIDVTA